MSSAKMRDARRCAIRIRSGYHGLRWEPTTGASDGGLRLGDQAVADSGLRQQVARARGHGLELAAELRDVEAQVLAVFGVAGPPHFLEELPVGQHLARMPDEGGEQLVLDRREM